VLAGEVIIDHKFYDAAGNREKREMTDNECLPFVQITSFQPEKGMPAQN
jgi:acetolactate decarboxylase